MSENNNSLGNIIRNETTGDEYQLIETDTLGLISTEIGNRELSDSQVPEVGDDCIRPTCNGVLEDVNGRRWCSEGCLEWFRTTPAQGDLCDKYGDKCDGQLDVNISENETVEYECDTCVKKGFASGVRWREARLPSHHQKAKAEN